MNMRAIPGWAVPSSHRKLNGWSRTLGQGTGWQGFRVWARVSLGPRVWARVSLGPRVLVVSSQRLPRLGARGGKGRGGEGRGKDQPGQEGRGVDSRVCSLRSPLTPPKP